MNDPEPDNSLPPQEDNVTISKAVLLPTFWAALGLFTLPLLLGIIVLAGWYTGNTTLIQVRPSFVPMQYNTALCFLLSGAALLAALKDLERKARWCGGITAAIGILTLLEYISGFDLRIDQLLMEHYIKTAQFPGRMAPNTALCFSLTGLTVFIMSKRAPSWFAVSILGSLIFGLGLVPFTGYLIGLETEFGWASLTTMAVHTSAGFILIGLGVLVYSWNQTAVTDETAPDWIPIPVAVALLTITICLWQATQVAEAIDFVRFSFLVFGLFLSVTTALAIRSAQASKKNESKLEDASIHLEKRVEERTSELKKSEERFRRILDSSSTGSAVHQDEEIKYASPRFAEIVGEPLNELIGKPGGRYWVNPEDRTGLLSEFNKRGSVQDYEAEFRRIDGSTFWVLISLYEINFEGRPARLTWLHDITLRKSMEGELQENETNLRQMLDSSSAGAVIISQDGGLVDYANPRFAEIMEASLEDLVGKPFGEYWEVREQQTEFLTQFMRQGQVRDFEMQLRSAGNNSRWCLLSAHSFNYLGNNASICWVYDITALKEIEGDLHAARDSAEDAAKAKSAFLAAMSHEIRTPMNGVVGMVDLLNQTKLDTEQRQMLNTVRDSGHSLLTIINDILDFSKIEAGKLDIESVEMAMTDVVEGSAQTMAPNAVKKGVKLLTYIDPDIAQFKKSDPTRVRQIIINMGGNAIKFSEEGQEVLIRADKVGSSDNGSSRIRFSIIDQGIGISEEAQKSLFEEFSQADASTTRKFGGTGLGLAICKRLTELMGGEIGVTSTLGEGSTFWVELPFEASDKTREERKVSDLSGLRVLVVSPSESYRENCRKYLNHWNADVEVTTDIDECLKRSQDAQKAGEPLDIIVIPDLDAQAKVANTRKAFIDAGLMPYPRFVIGEDPRAKSDILKGIEEVTMMDINPMRRAGMLTAVAIAAGRASPEVHYQEEVEVIKSGRTPTVEEALEQGKLILLAEDNLTNQLVIRRQLNTLGYQCEIANDGKEGFEMWQEKSYCMLLTDCHMPEWDGFELTDAVRKSEESTDKRAPIVAITANALQGEADRCIAAGMDDYMSKPVEMKTLKQTLFKWMGEGSTFDETDDEVAAEASTQAETPSQENAGDNGKGSCPIDDRMLKDMFGDDDAMFKEILQSFVEPSETIVADLIAAHESRSADGVKAEAHKLKSSSRSVGANELADTCLALETAGKDEDWATIDDLAPKLEPLFKEVKGYVESL